MPLDLLYSRYQDRAGLDDVSVQLLGTVEPSERFSFLVQDPQNKESYFWRKVKLFPTLVVEDGDPRALCMSYTQIDLGGFYASRAFTGQSAMQAVKDILSAEKKMRDDEPDKAAMVGVAKYTGHNGMTLEKMVPLVALKFAKLQKALSVLEYPSSN